MNSPVSRLRVDERASVPRAVSSALRDTGKSLFHGVYRSALRLNSRYRALFDAERALDRDDWSAAIARLEDWSKSHPRRGMEGSSLEAQILAALRQCPDAPAREFDDGAIPDLHPVPNPGMITAEEEKLYYFVAKESFDPARAVVEIGPWLGRGTQRVCDGLEARSANWRLICFDRFQWNRHFSRIVAAQGAETATRQLRKGDSFEAAFRTLMGARAGRITSIQGTLARIDTRLGRALPANRNVGTLFVDASKDWLNNVRLLRFFSDRLAGGAPPSTILFQDFLYFPAYRLIFLTMLIPGIRPVLYCRTGCSVVFEVASGISPNERAFRPDLPETLSQAAIEAAWQRLCRAIPLSRLQQNAVQLALPLMLWSCGHYDAAVGAFREIQLSKSEHKLVANTVGGADKAKLAPLRALLRAGDSIQRKI